MSQKVYAGRIELTKYKDMAYCNRTGRAWLRVLSCAEVWGLWENELRAFSRALDTNVSAERVKVGMALPRERRRVSGLLHLP